MKLEFFLFVLVTFAGAHLPYTEDNGKLHYYYASVVNCQDESIINWSCQHPCDKISGMQDVKNQIVFNQFNNIKAYTGYQSTTNQIVLSFRHTKDWKNWIVDGEFKLKNFELCANCKVHRGFVNAFHSIKPQVLANMKAITARYPNATVTVVGHSLGAALATLAAIEVQHEGYVIDSLYTYGSPRVGNAEFAHYVDSKLNSFRHVHNADTAVHVPPQFLGYKHVVQEIWQSEAGDSYVVCSDTDSEDPNCSNSISTSKYRGDDHNDYFGLSIACIE